MPTNSVQPINAIATTYGISIGEKLTTLVGASTALAFNDSSYYTFSGAPGVIHNVVLDALEDANAEARFFILDFRAASFAFALSVSGSVSINGGGAGMTIDSNTKIYLAFHVSGGNWTISPMFYNSMINSLGILGGSSTTGNILFKAEAGATVTLSGQVFTIGGSGITGSGTTNTIPKFTAASVLGNSSITDDGTTITAQGIALTSSNSKIGKSIVVDGNSSISISAITHNLPVGNFSVLGIYAVGGMQDVSGFAGTGTAFQKATVYCCSSSPIRLLNDNIGSDVGKRIYTPTGNNLIIWVRGAVDLIYDGAYWRVVNESMKGAEKSFVKATLAADINPVGTGGYILIPFDTVASGDDVRSEMDIVTNKGRFTPKEAGKYHITGQISWTGAGFGVGKTAFVYVSQNGSPAIIRRSFTYGTGAYTAIPINETVTITDAMITAGTAYIEIYIYNTEANKIISGGALDSFVSIIKQ